MYMAVKSLSKKGEKPKGPPEPKQSSSQAAEQKARDVGNWNNGHKPVRTSQNQRGH